MAFEDTLEQVEAVELNGANNETPKPDSVKERLRERREELRAKTTLELLVPGYDGELAVRYKAIPGEEAEQIGRKLTATGGQALGVACDFLIRCCESILVRSEGTLEPLVDDKDEAVVFDYRLAEVFGIEYERARKLVLDVFSPERNRDLAVIEHSTSLLNWMQGHEEEIDRSLLDF